MNLRTLHLKYYSQECSEVSILYYTCKLSVLTSKALESAQDVDPCQFIGLPIVSLFVLLKFYLTVWLQV